MNPQPLDLESNALPLELRPLTLMTTGGLLLRISITNILKRKALESNIHIASKFIYEPSILCYLKL